MRSVRGPGFPDHRRPGLGGWGHGRAAVVQSPEGCRQQARVEGSGSRHGVCADGRMARWRVGRAKPGVRTCASPRRLALGSNSGCRCECVVCREGGEVAEVVTPAAD